MVTLTNFKILFLESKQEKMSVKVSKKSAKIGMFLNSRVYKAVYGLEGVQYCKLLARKTQ